MIELLFAALIDTTIAVIDPATVYVHEWGAVTFTSEQVFFGSAPMEGEMPAPLLPDEWEEPVARAPVVYFYGAPFSGVFRVTVPSGAFIEAVPDPAVLSDTRGMPLLPSSYTAQWNLSGDPEGSTSTLTTLRETGYIECIPAELMDSWRTPPSHVLQFDDGSSEKFVYYECSLTPLERTSFKPAVLGPEGAMLDPAYEGEYMRFFQEGSGEVRAERCTHFGPVVPVSLEDGTEIVEILCDWAGGAMKTEELRALWDTWSGWVAESSGEDGDLLMFPFPSSTVEGMTTIRLVPDQMLDVEYTRFFVGFVRDADRTAAPIPQVNT